MQRIVSLESGLKGSVYELAGRPAIAATGTHIPYEITQCYLPPSRGDIPVVLGYQRDDFLSLYADVASGKLKAALVGYKCKKIRFITTCKAHRSSSV